MKPLPYAFAIVFAVALGGCSRRADALGSKPSTSVSAPAASTPAPLRTRKGGLDVSFYATADTHFGVPGIEHWHRVITDSMNSLPGKDYPAAIGGKVGTVRGVLIAGDLTDNDSVEQWQAFTRFYGPDGAIRFPVFESVGNHDFWNAREEVKKRHGALWYAFDFDDLHVACLGEAPTDETLDWLERDLAKLAPDVPVVLYQHFPLAGPYSDTWFTREHHDERLAKVVSGHNVVAFLHGHYHASGAYRWHGIDVYDLGSPKHRARSFAVVHVTDKSLSVSSYNYELGTWWWWHQKPINGAAGSDISGMRGVPDGGPVPFLDR